MARTKKARVEKPKEAPEEPRFINTSTPEFREYVQQLREDADRLERASDYLYRYGQKFPRG